ncbi:MAG: barstar family protein [Oscillospiraceae bacterium]|nr:barstar family protein [Oscillospiraceae bacterium]
MVHVYELDGVRLAQEGHAYLREVFGFPDYYGDNADALYDCLSSLSEETLVFLGHADEAPARLVQVMQDAVDANPRFTLIEEA